MLVTRTVLPTAPIGVEYAITPLGQSLPPPLEAIGDRALVHHAELNTPRARDCGRDVA